MFRGFPKGFAGWTPHERPPSGTTYSHPTLTRGVKANIKGVTRVSWREARDIVDAPVQMKKKRKSPVAA